MHFANIIVSAFPIQLLSALYIDLENGVIAGTCGSKWVNDESGNQLITLVVIWNPLGSSNADYNGFNLCSAVSG